MDKKFVRKMVVFMIAAAMILSSGAGVFAAGSSEVGVVKNLNSAENTSKSRVWVTWTKTKGATGYKLYKNGKYYKTVSADKTGAYIRNIKEGTSYTIQIAAIAPDGKTIGPKTTVKKLSASKRWMKPVKVYTATPGTGKATIKWKKVSGATGYMIVYSKDKKKWSYKMVTGGSKTSSIVRKLSKGKWFYRVRPIKGEYWGELCTYRTVRVK